MNWDQVEGKWKQMKGAAKEKWGKLTEDDLEAISGRQDQLIGKLQERYGIVREEAQKRADEWIKAYHEPEGAHYQTSNPTHTAGRR
jgi:uncharacterized protein YjbJ (UPF0337 family)